MSDILFLTDEAKDQMVNMLKEHSKNAVRLALKGGGCAGFKYDWTLEDDAQKDDAVIDLPTGKFLVDPASIMYLLGSTVDYKREVFGSYFDIKNPGSVSSCGCGESVGF
ncbi:MAG: iron-sulfur cluster assembly accessory protein [Euryarchaeota archaeon]|nr:iron-sulfur cluster assembly accessory protein [Euryarchaeota archaeon]